MGQAFRNGPTTPPTNDNRLERQLASGCSSSPYPPIGQAFSDGPTTSSTNDNRLEEQSASECSSSTYSPIGHGRAFSDDLTSPPMTQNQP